MEKSSQALAYLFAAYSVIWIIIAIYLLIMGEKISRLRKDLENLEESLKKK